MSSVASFFNPEDTGFGISVIVNHSHMPSLPQHTLATHFTAIWPLLSEHVWVFGKD